MEGNRAAIQLATANVLKLATQIMVVDVDIPFSHDLFNLLHAIKYDYSVNSDNVMILYTSNKETKIVKVQIYSTSRGELDSACNRIKKLPSDICFSDYPVHATNRQRVKDIINSPEFKQGHCVGVFFPEKSGNGMCLFQYSIVYC